jgi:hypothetical protein
MLNHSLLICLIKINIFTILAIEPMLWMLLTCRDTLNRVIVLLIGWLPKGLVNTFHLLLWILAFAIRSFVYILLCSVNSLFALRLTRMIIKRYTFCYWIYWRFFYFALFCWSFIWSNCNCSFYAWSYNFIFCSYSRVIYASWLSNINKKITWIGHYFEDCLP